MTLTPKESAALGLPDLIDTMFAHVSNGGTLHGLADLWDVRVAVLYEWVDKDEERRAKLLRAEKARDNWGREVLWEYLRDLATFKVTDLFEPDGRLKPLDQWPAAAARAVAGLETEELFEFDYQSKEKVHLGTAKKVKLIDRSKSLKQLGDFLGTWAAQKVEHSGTLTLEQLLAASRDKA